MRTPHTVGAMDEAAGVAGMSCEKSQKLVPELHPLMTSISSADNTTLTRIEPRQPRRLVKKKNT
jgi:hypothetical protein